ncbi:hypothetical protein V6N12_019991 [Hibiscus sabdariffa]|uniref:Reverse transcriptase zinc-binding domain-containing protein n=1 Tax=Hibiscus sabdariffa TaxID=183260 RepID=A0ABR2BGM0_9ROSI
MVRLLTSSMMFGSHLWGLCAPMSWIALLIYLDYLLSTSWMDMAIGIFICSCLYSLMSISSAYESLVNSVWDAKSSCWKCFWAQPVPQRLRFFLWLSFKERLMTNVERCRRFIGQSPICPCCHMYAETTAHVLRDCQFATVVWLLLIPPELHADFFTSNFQVWLLSNLTTACSHPGSGLNWSIVFASTIWQLWNRRNNWVFNGHCSSTEFTYHKSVTWARYYAESNLFKECDQSDSGLPPLVHWQHPDEGWIYLNTDGDSELWVILTGLQLARDNGYELLMVQSDSFEAITRLNASTSDSDLNALVRAITRLRSVEWVTTFRWIPREANKLADAMAKLDASYVLSLFDTPPTPCNHF